MRSTTSAARETRLRQRIDRVTDERDELADVLEHRDRIATARRRARGGKPSARCVYCGHGCYALTCGSHDDLPGLDPHYNQALTAVVEAAA